MKNINEKIRSMWRVKQNEGKSEGIKKEALI